MAIPSSAINLSSIFLGTCIPSLKHNASKFKVNYLYFDEYLKKYFKKHIVVFAYDTQKICKTGDIALIQEMPHSETPRLINHQVLEIVFPCGELTDPVTGKKIIKTTFRDKKEAEKQLFGKTGSEFKYEEAPIRGWQENRKDFSHRPVYRKYNEFPDEDENKDQPHSTLC